MSNSLWSYGLQTTRLLCPWNSLGKNTEVDCHSLLQGIFPTQGWNPGLLRCRQILYHLSRRKAPSFTFRSDQISRSVVSGSLRLHDSQHARPPCPSPTPGVHSDSCPSSQWCHQPSHPLLSLSPPAPNPSQHQSLFQWVNSSHEVAKILEFQL